ncbi:MAG: chromosome segregation protein SMC [Chloroflexi bacterium]|nr:chromosome segregation protein SMC [Chloroflexota bacterium]
MYLKRLQVQGFKTFANKTEFLYDEGMTAVVGPNGSGKSNVADAIRWVLGEQKYSVLRSRKTEDVIFAGSSLKPAMGYAEASITFDNTDGKLPLAFNEVTITRRAYRTGENEYYINKNKVRLKDITEALMPLSQAYTVITQGMVDAALSQKPEERRGLFEDAADIGRYNLKKAETETRLNKTEENSLRVADLLGEIGPRLKGLERHAKQAEEFYTLQEELQVLLKRHYAHRWRRAVEALELAHQTEKQAENALNVGKARIDTLQEEMNTSRAIQTERRNWLAERHRESSSLHSRAQQLQKQVAVDQERLNGLLRQREAQGQELVNLRVAQESATRRLNEVEHEFDAVRTEQGGERERLTQQETTLKEKASATRTAEARLTKRRDDLAHQNNRLESVKNRRGQLGERRTELARQEEKYIQARNATLVRQAELEEQIVTAQRIVGSNETESGELVERRKVLEASLAGITETLRQVERSIGELRSKRDSARARLDLMQRLQSNFAGLFGGVKSVMQAAQSQAGRPARLQGVLGLVANLLEAPASLELAIETALGGHLQDIVVEQWRDAEEAIALLKSTGAGRATFLPLDSLKRNPSSNSRQGGAIANREGVRGIAAELVGFEERYRVVYEQLLGRVLVCEDLRVARAILHDLTGGWTAVTLGGEIVRSGGAVTGGGSGREKERTEGSVLMRERELRELPQEVARLEKALQQEAYTLSQHQAQATHLRQQQQELDREVQQLTRQQQQGREKLANLKAQSDRLTDELRLREENYQGLAGERAKLDEREKSLELEKQEAEATREAIQEEIKGVNQEVWQAKAAENEEREKLAGLRTASALAEQRLKNSETNLKLAKTELARLQEQSATRQVQLNGLEERRRTLQTSLDAAELELDEVSGKLEELQSSITPLEQELEALEKTQSQREQHWVESSNDLFTLEGAHTRAVLETQRTEGELENIKQRAADDLAPSFGGSGGIEEARAEVMADPNQWQELLDMDENEARKNFEKVEQLRNKLRRIGVVNPLAQQEYREAKERHEFLSTQLTDLQETSTSLRALIKQLDTLTQSRFATTFEQVAEHFKKYFGILFNGGTAKLTLTAPDNLADTGIDIIAQPPGKRQQALALLSGGERALTAVALLFALLEVNPTPFCILDEVDAALDEANVKRFCQTLKLLSEKTQFIVITHNRGTIEAARTIYGISMGPDSISKVISLRVDEVAAFRETGAKGSKREKAKEEKTKEKEVVASQ